MKKAILTKKAPLPIGPYNQAIQYNNLLFVSGQIPINPETGNLIESGIKQETIQVMENLKKILKEGKMNFENVVKTTIFLKDMNDFVNVNTEYGKYFENCIPPARETVQVSQLPLNVNVEISCIAIKD
jgi:2-iminobutanoate/2-iminopropanoate deaminase|tara:strand:+ start:737 stop:1120 length:384 start_codon:yes stop_codon:yes gene_type:complete